MSGAFQAHSSSENEGLMPARQTLTSASRLAAVVASDRKRQLFREARFFIHLIRRRVCQTTTSTGTMQKSPGQARRADDAGGTNAADIGGAIAQVTAVCNTILRFMPPGMTPPNVIQFNASNVPVVQLTARSDTLTPTHGARSTRDAKCARRLLHYTVGVDGKLTDSASTCDPKDPRT